MTVYHTKYNAVLKKEEYYQCHDCGEVYDDYNSLHFYDDFNGGFCPACNSEALDVYSKYTVYQTVYAKSGEHAVEECLHHYGFEVMEGEIKLMEKQNVT